MVRHVAGIAEIVDDIEEALKVYRDTLGLKIDYEPGSGYATVQIEGVLHFGIWGRQQAAEAMFGEGAEDNKVPLGFLIGYEVDSVEASSEEFTGKGGQLIQAPKTEPWGQVTSRFTMPSGAVAEFSETPWARRISQGMEVEAEAGNEQK